MWGNNFRQVLSGLIRIWVPGLQRVVVVWIWSDLVLLEMSPFFLSPGGLWGCLFSLDIQSLSVFFHPHFCCCKNKSTKSSDPHVSSQCLMLSFCLTVHNGDVLSFINFRNGLSWGDSRGSDSGTDPAAHFCYYHHCQNKNTKSSDPLVKICP